MRTPATFAGKPHLLHHLGCRWKEIGFSWCGAFGVFEPVSTSNCRECEQRFVNKDPAIPDIIAIRDAKRAEKAKAGKK